MTPKQLAELKDNVDLRKRLAKKIAHDCFRDTKTLENMHAANLITDDEMKAITTEATDKCYELVLDLCSPHCVETISNSATRCPSGTTPKFVSTYARESCVVVGYLRLVELSKGRENRSVELESVL